jgi:hypothetical protein
LLGSLAPFAPLERRSEAKILSNEAALERGEEELDPERSDLPRLRDESAVWRALVGVREARRRGDRLARMSLALVTSWLLLWGAVAIYGISINLRAS